MLDCQAPLPLVLSFLPTHQDEYTMLPHSIISIHSYIPVYLVTIPAEVRNPRDSGMNHLGAEEEVPGCPLVPTASRCSRPSIMSCTRAKVLSLPERGPRVVWAQILPVSWADLALLKEGGSCLCACPSGISCLSPAALLCPQLGSEDR